MSRYENLDIALHDGIAVIRLAREERRNALSIDLSRELGDALSDHADATAIAAIVLTGADPAFCAGMDLREASHARDPALFHEQLEVSARYHRLLWNYPKPVVCAVNGPALGGGLDLSTLCDIRIASDRATFGDPQIRFGLPALFTPLRWLIGDGHARELCLTGRIICAAEALRLGLVSRVVEHRQLLDQAIQLAKDIAQAPPETLKLVKAYMASAAPRNFEESLRVEHDEAFAAVFTRVGSAERASAFAEAAAHRLAHIP